MFAEFAHAHIRFGLGRSPEDVFTADPREVFSAQLEATDSGPEGAGVADAFVALRQDRQDRPPPGQPGRARQIFRAETHALQDWALHTPLPFRERLVAFWANHFTVSQRRGEVAPLAGAYVREAIRPHVTGRFADMLLAVMRHPAMLLYLDNAGSAGPSSPAGRRSSRGLNENLARECLELHTVSPAAGYTQTDVTSFAHVLTGWSVDRREQPGFRFRPFLHEPGEKTILARTFPEGEAGGEAALRFLAGHQATHRHLATKLVQHFVADTPPSEAVRRIEAVLRDTQGDLKAASRAVLALPQAWTPLAKLRSPQELVIAAFRAAALPPERMPDLNGIMAGLGQPMFGAQFPIGWPDTAADWAGPEAIMRRIDWAYGFSGRSELPDANAFAELTLGPLLSNATASEMRHAGSRRDAMTMLLASPEFQRR